MAAPSAKEYEEMIYGPLVPEVAAVPEAASAPDSHVSEPEFIKKMSPSEKRRFYIALGATVATAVVGANVYWYTQVRPHTSHTPATKIEPSPINQVHPDSRP